jgi:hypothetical protein
MLAKKLSNSVSDLPTRPFNPRPAPRFEGVASQRTHLMLVREPLLTPRGLAWAQDDREEFDSARLQAMLRFERLNLG